ncbi:type IV pilus modification protein PilV [Desulfobotulus mexicanus]|uniref:Type IV pilus modification protein PilV n=2 Tax=Desulfobotulus mexicanus TaxID=2586642 RepID=A0A5Q4VFJ0_9BACT|nr:type IV pilus modification protein PilV [Desulfobotulus mexicanus]
MEEPAPQSSSGFTLMEVLLVLVILSIGLLGLAVLQNMALKDNHNALLRSRAVQQAEDILDRIRANRNNLGDYVIAIGATPAVGGMAGTDLTEWRRGLALSLPGGDGSVAVDAATGVVTVVVQWRESVRGEDGESDDEYWTVVDGSISRQISISTRP